MRSAGNRQNRMLALAIVTSLITESAASQTPTGGVQPTPPSSVEADSVPVESRAARSSAQPCPSIDSDGTSESCPPPAQTCTNDYCPPQEAPPREDKKSDDGWIAPAVIGGGLLALIVGRSLFKGDGAKPQANDLPKSKWLNKHGPQLATTFPMGTFSAKGFARNGWPIVVDFKSEPGTRTLLDVIFKRRKVTLDVERSGQLMEIGRDGIAGRRLIKLRTPDDGPAIERAKPAMYVLRSIRTDTQAPASIEVYGIGGGPQAVGSVAIENLRFTPGQFQFGPTGKIDYQYTAKSPFNQTREEVLSFRQNGDTIVLERVMSAKRVGVSAAAHAGRWYGVRQDNRRPSIGLHRFQVRGWFTSDDKSWVGAIAPNVVTVRP